MQIPKDKILDLMRDQGKSDQVGQAEQELRIWQDYRVAA